MGKLIKYISILIVIVLVLSACGKAVIKAKE
ncbi:Oligopeptide-binding protein oppA [Staphylococcus aureus]|nr:Oligopeptide-binding protein oppA [Staphylococcus aureus]